MSRRSRERRVPTKTHFVLIADASRARRQAYVIDTISGSLTVVVVLLIAELKAIASHWQASAGAGVALVAIAAVVVCAVGHKERPNAETADDDESLWSRWTRGSRGSRGSRDDADDADDANDLELMIMRFMMREARGSRDDAGDAGDVELTRIMRMMRESKTDSGAPSAVEKAAAPATVNSSAPPDDGAVADVSLLDAPQNAVRRCRSASEDERVKRSVFATDCVQSERPSLEEKIEHEPFANDATKPTALGIHPNADSDSAWVVSQAVDKTVDKLLCCNTGGREDESAMAEYSLEV